MLNTRRSLLLVVVQVAVLFPVNCLAQSKAHALRQLPVGETSSDKILIQSLMEEIRRDTRLWREQIEFVGTFEQRECWKAESPLDASAQVDVSNDVVRGDKTRVVATGTFAKLNSALRFQLMGSQPLVVHRDGPSVTTSGIHSLDTCSANGIEFQFRPVQATNDGMQMVGTIHFGRFEYLPEKVLTTTSFFAFPFDSMGGIDGDPFRYLGKFGSAEYLFENINGGFQISISADLGGVPAAANFDVYKFSFRDTPHGPLLEENTFVSQHGRTDTKLKDFVDCGNGLMLPRGMILVQTTKAGSFARSWYSADVGDRQPQEADFDLKVPAGTRWFGYKPENIDPKRRNVNQSEMTINILKIEPVEVESSYQPPIPR